MNRYRLSASDPAMIEIQDETYPPGAWSFWLPCATSTEALAKLRRMARLAERIGESAHYTVELPDQA